MPKTDPRTPNGPAFVHDPPNTLLRIDALWAFVSVDGQGNEGLCGFPVFPENGGPAYTMPMISADPARLDSLRAVAKRLAGLTEKRIRLVKLSTREELEVIDP